jgi:glutamate synthase (NADPH/NADH) large chain
MYREPSAVGLYDPAATRASCGVGAAVNLDGTATHALIETACTMLRNLDHRGARGAEEGTGDGAGILLQKPHAFFAARIEGLPGPDEYGVGQVFLPQQTAAQDRLCRLIESAAGERGLAVLAWRRVPTGEVDLGRTARASEPAVFQFFVAATDPLPPASLDAQLYLLRRLIERRAEAAGFPRERCYVCSLDRRRVVYKGLLTCGQLQPYFPDLSEPDLASALALVHSRFSTNTLGAWHLAHPYRCLVHNGEVNTLRGNQNWMRTREADLASPHFGDDIALLQPVTAPDVSDSSALDNVLELLIESGRPLPHALRMMIPEAWSKDRRMAPERRAFYDYHSAIMEPWDGPALVVASDGERVAAVLDRNGLRPCRIWITRDGRLILGSETGLVDLPAGEIAHKGRLRPGQLLLADTREGRIVPEDEVFTALTAPPYADWLAANRVRLDDCPAPPGPVSQAPDTGAGLTGLQRAFGYTEESLRRVIEPMAANAKDAIGAMGNDAPPAALSGLHRPLFDYFTQLFAQVSNPPIDYLREDLVTSLEGHIGRQRNLLETTPAHCRQLLLRSPILGAGDLDKILRLDTNGIRARRIPFTCAADTPFDQALAALRAEARAAIADGIEILILSDRDLGPQRLALPSLLAVGAVHHDLIRRGLRTRAGLVLDSGQPCGVHHVCTLLGYGADAVHPWLAVDTVGELVERGLVAGPSEDATGRYCAALEDGVLKVMSKMGISTLQSYRGAQVFEALGLAPELIDDCFSGTWCPIPGATLADLEHETRALHAHAFAPTPPGNAALPPGGQLYWRRDGELHQWTPQTIGWLQQAARSGDEAAYRRFAAAVDAEEGRLQTLRGLLEFALDPAQSIPVNEVEPEEALMRRFATGSMSFGARDEPHRGDLRHRRGRRAGRALRHRARLLDEAGRERALRRDDRLPGPGPPDRDQDGAGLQAW